MRPLSLEAQEKSLGWWTERMQPAFYMTRVLPSYTLPMYGIPRRMRSGIPCAPKYAFTLLDVHSSFGGQFWRCGCG